MTIPFDLYRFESFVYLEKKTIFYNRIDTELFDPVSNFGFVL